MKKNDKNKVIYGCELTLADDNYWVVFRPTNDNLFEATYVVFDFETTGFNASSDSIIGIGAVKICNGEIIDRFSELINPGIKLNSFITSLTNITNDMLIGKDDEKTVIKRFVDWCGDLPMVSHNAEFDISFFEYVYKKYGFGEFNNMIIDILKLSHVINSDWNRHSLHALAKKYDVCVENIFNVSSDYDSFVAALIFNKMLKVLEKKSVKKISDLNKLVNINNVFKYGHNYQINLIVLNDIGFKNLSKLLASAKQFNGNSFVFRSEIIKHREGLLVGSGCYKDEIFDQARNISDEDLCNLLKFYDYVTIQPISCYSQLIQIGYFDSEEELISHLRKIIRITKKCGKLIVATDNKGAFTCKNASDINSLKNFNQYFKGTLEKLEEFNFLPLDEAKELVITNTNKIVDMCEDISPIIEK